MQEVLTVNGLCKTFRLSKRQQRLQKSKSALKVAVDNLSFKVYGGEVYGLLGPNGAGKTTTLRAIATLIKADSGEINVMGHCVRRAAQQVRRRIGFLTSELRLEDFFTPDYLFDYFAGLHGLEAGVAKKRKQQLFEKFGIDNFREVKVANLSSGMKQKVSIVISLAHDPEIIIFDEPTNGLDVITAKTVTDFLIDFKAMGKTVILSTHIFSLAEKLCDRVGIIIDGKMTADGAITDIAGGKSLEDKFFELYELHGGDGLI